MLESVVEHYDIAVGEVFQVFYPEKPVFANRYIYIGKLQEYLHGLISDN
jgi:hypothetical protein